MPSSSDATPEFTDAEVLALTSVVSSSEALLASFAEEAAATENAPQGVHGLQEAPTLLPRLSAFIDESEQGGEYYFLGALLATDRQVELIETALDSLLAEFSNAHKVVDAAAEFHGYEMMQGRGKWKKVPIRMVGNIYVRALEAISASGASFYFEGIDIRALHERYITPWPPREVAMSHLLEKIDEHAGRLRSTVHLHADEHHTAEDHRQQLNLAQQNGTYGYKSSKLQNCHSDFKFLDSKDYRCIQAADLVTYILNREKAVVEANDKALTLKRRMIAGLMPALNRGRHRIWP
ncbi:DUF3800 domain-containing protein [Brevibacterium sp. 'Marine']|uniref:DUF3800 domain-containing protein n=1 Tax=Brevibacterium sp. 'Marine' TaxID=2725563 RepID=UPI00145DF7A8|nr:DUF3800 domain-containing protein [Brevibacterium sp. 'Marine']